MPKRPLAACLVASALSSLPSLGAGFQDFGLQAAVPVGPYLNGVFPDVAPGSADTYTATPAYPALTFTEVLAITTHPRERIVFVGERAGRVWSFLDDPGVTFKALFLDVSERCVEVVDGGFMGFALHPDFGDSTAAGGSSAFAFYCYAPPGTAAPGDGGGFQGVYLRLSRFEVPSGSTVADPDSEEVLIQLRMYNASHRGGHLAFGPDGFLYVPVGDQFRFETAQDLAGNLEGGILRIDVDQDPLRSHAPLRTLPLNQTDEVSGAGYWIPNDNPFADPTGARFEEYWTIGHRNPHRIGFDPVTGELWSGEVGSVLREEINLLAAGGNYGWPFREGLIAGPGVEPPTFEGALTDPVVEFTRGESTAIIGGVVYRGARHPGLYGRYLCSDYLLTTLFALRFDAPSGSYVKEVIGSLGVGSSITFGVDHAGEVLVGIQRANFPLHTLVGTNPTPEPPARLSDLGAFAELTTLKPAAGWIPFDVNSPLWSDGAKKSRWVAIPNDGSHEKRAEQVVFDRRGNWVLPAGTVTMKHFALPDDEGDPGSMRRLETRFVVFTESGFYGVSYHWNEAGTDATLALLPRVQSLPITRADGSVRFQDWHFPGREQCLQCHSAPSGGALGLRTHQLNRSLWYEASGVSDHQLRAWDHIGLLAPREGTPPFSVSEISDLPRAAGIHDAGASLATRATSYLDSNCAGCHRPGVVQRARFDARFHTPFHARDLVGVAPLDSLGIEEAALVVAGAPHRSAVVVRASRLDGAAMPPTGRALVDEAGVQVLRDWIRSLAPYEHVLLGGELAGKLENDVWAANLVISESDAWVSEATEATRVRPEAFRFRAETSAGPVTPFLALRLGDDAFQIVAIGDTRSPEVYEPGENRFPFSNGASSPVAVPPGGTLVIGFLDASPDGTGGGGAVIPFCPCHEGGEVWRTGGASAGSITIGGPPVPGPETATTDLRRYAFGIDLVIEADNTAPTLDELAPVSVLEGALMRVAVTAHDYEDDDLTYSATGLPDGVEMDPTTGEIAGVVALQTRGTYVIRVSASDGQLVSVAEFTLTVNPAR